MVLVVVVLARDDGTVAQPKYSEVKRAHSVAAKEVLGVLSNNPVAA